MAATALMKATRVMKTGRANPGTHERTARERVTGPARLAASTRPVQERIPRIMRQKVEALLQENYAFMDSIGFSSSGSAEWLMWYGAMTAVRPLKDHTIP